MRNRVFGRMSIVLALLAIVTLGAGSRDYRQASSDLAFAADGTPSSIRWVVAQEGMPTMSGSAYGAGRYVLVGGREIWTSKDGLHWSSAANPAPAEVSHVIYAGSQFVAVGSGGILTSLNGLHWKPRSTRAARCVAYGNGRYVAPSWNWNTILTSSDGLTWTEHAAPGGWASESVAFGGGIFVAVGGSVVHTSPDGVTWTQQTSVPEPALSRLQSVVYAAGKFFAATACCGPSGVMSSSDGVHWTNLGIGFGELTGGGQSMTAAGPTDNLVALLEHASGWVSEGGDPIPCGTVECWPGWPGYPFPSVPGLGRDLMTITWGPPGFVAAGPGGVVFFLPQEDYAAWKAGDATKTWQNATLLGSRLFTDAIWTPSGYCAVGAAGLSATSANGRDWAYGSVPLWTEGWSWPMHAQGEGRFAAVLGGDLDVLATSSDCANWTVVQEGTPGDIVGYVLNDVAYGNGVFIAVGVYCAYGGHDCSLGALASDDGLNWVPRDPAGPIPANFYGGPAIVAFGNGRFVTAGPEHGSDGYVLTSDDDGLTWTRHAAPFEAVPADIGFGNGVFVAVTSRIWTSPDGVTWTPRTDGPAVAGYVNFYNPGFRSGGVTWAGDRFVVVGHNGQVYSSADGTSWTAEASGTHHNLAAAAHSPELGRLVALGESIATYSTGRTR